MDWVAKYEVEVRLHPPEGERKHATATKIRHLLIDVIGPECDLIDITTINVGEEEW